MLGHPLGTIFSSGNTVVENKVVASLTICCVENQIVMSHCSCFSSDEGNMNTQLWLSGLKGNLLNTNHSVCPHPVNLQTAALSHSAEFSS